jgi:hypothetical protein
MGRPRKKLPEQSSGAEPSGSSSKPKYDISILDKAAATMMEAAQEAGMSLVSAAEAGTKDVVVPIPPISLQWLINANGWPLGRMTSCGGKPKTFKSTFGFQLMAWTVQAGGIAQLLDTEGKVNESLLRLMMLGSGLPLTGSLRCGLTHAHSFEAWHNSLLYTADKWLRDFSKPENCPYPAAYVVDSLTGANSQSATDELAAGEDTGMSRTGQLNAKRLYAFFRDTARMFHEVSHAKTAKTWKRSYQPWPSFFHFVHQLREGGGQYEPDTKSGGASPDFFTSLDIKFTNARGGPYGSKTVIDTGGRTGKHIDMQVNYSSMGPSGKSQHISVPVLIGAATEQGVPGTQTVGVYDWGAADTHFLVSQYDKIKHLFDIENKRANSCKEVRSTALGMTDFVHMSEFGEMVQDNKELMKAIRGCLGIPTKEEFIFEPGVLYKDNSVVTIHTDSKVDLSEFEPDVSRINIDTPNNSRVDSEDNEDKYDVEEDSDELE